MARCIVFLENGERLAGKLPAKYDREISSWIDEHRDSLLKLWKEMRESGKTELLLKEIRKEYGKHEKKAAKLI